MASLGEQINQAVSSVSAARYLDVFFPRPLGANQCDGSFSLGGFLRDFFRAWRKIMVWIVLCMFLGVLYLTHATPRYSVTGNLIPIPDWLSIQPQNPATGLSSLLGGNQVNMFELVGESIQEKQIYVELDNKFQVRRRLFPELWNVQTGRWDFTLDHSFLGWLRRGIIALRAMAGYPAWGGPTIDSVRDYYSKMIILTTNTDGSVTIEMKSARPSVDVPALEFILARADDIIRAQMMNYVQKTIDGLQIQLQTANETVLRSTLIASLGSQLSEKASLQNNRILAMQMAPISVSDVPRYPSWPGVIAVAFLLGILIPAAVLFCRSFFH